MNKKGLDKNEHPRVLSLSVKRSILRNQEEKVSSKWRDRLKAGSIVMAPEEGRGGGTQSECDVCLLSASNQEEGF